MIRRVGVAFLLWAIAQSAVADEWVYRVRPGDNLWDLAQKYLVSMRYWRPLQRLNRIDDPLHLLPGTRLRMPTAWSRLRTVDARVVAAEGAARIRPRGAAEARPARPGEHLGEGDRVDVPEGASLLLEFSDGTRLLLQGGSEITLERLEGYGDGEVGQTRLRLPEGRLESQANPNGIPATRFEITTPSALTAVRGTRFRIAVADHGERSRVEVIEGRVEVAGEGGRVPVGAGFGVVAGEGAAPAPRKLLSPPDGIELPAVVEEVSFALRPQPDPGAVLYRVLIATPGGLTPPRYDRVFEPGAMLVDLSALPDADYLLRVRAVDRDGLEGRETTRRFTLNTRPPPPIQLTPEADSRFADPRPEFAWARPEGAVAYHFELATDQGMAQPLLDLARVTGERLTLEHPLAPGGYFWRVTALDADGRPGPRGVVRRFRVLPEPPESAPPELEESGITFHWRPGREGEWYRFQLATDPTFTQLITDSQMEEARFHLADPQPGTYYMRVKTIDAEGFQGPFGRVQSVVVPEPPKDMGWLVLIPAAFMALLTLL